MKKLVGLACGLFWAATAGAAQLSVEFTFSADDVSLTPAGEYTEVGLAGGSRVANEPGAPSIPAKFANILLPAGAGNIRISASGAGELLAGDIVPRPEQPRSPKSRPRPAFVPANDRYASADAWPAEPAAYAGDHDMQGYRFVSVRVNPLAYVGAEKALYLRKRVVVTATYDLAAAPRAIAPKQQSLFGPLVNSLVVNPEAAPAFAPAVRAVAPKAAVDYLIITSSALSNAFQRIADYRASAAGGSYSTLVLTTNTVGADYPGADLPAKIRACISNSVATLGTTMVLLGGDDTHVPARFCYVGVVSSDTYETNMPTDLYYSGLNGSWNSDGDARYGETSDGVDLAWDVVVARLPVRTATQTTNYLNKVVSYESRSPTATKIILGGPEAWYTYTGTSRPSDDVTGDGHAGFRQTTTPAHASVSDSEMWMRRLYRDGIRAYWPATVGLMCDTITSWDTTACGDHLESAANTLAAFNKNWTHLMFSGHGAPQVWGLESGDFTQANAASMTGMTAFVYTDACMTGHFDKNSNSIDGYSYTVEPCLGESFLRNANTLGGAVAYMGCARYGWGEPDASPASNTSDGGPSTVYAYKFYKRLYESPGRTLGTAFAMHKADMAGLCGTDEAERWIQFGMNLLGDPALKAPVEVPPTDLPPTLSVNPAGTNKSVAADSTLSFAVTATDPDGLAVSLSAADLPAGATAPATSRTASVTTTFDWTPSTNQIGVVDVVFTATDDDGSAAVTIRIAVSGGGGGGTAPDLFISEYIEGGNSDKYIEIFNGTGVDADLADYKLRLYGNGAGTPSSDVALSGTLANGATKVYRNSGAVLATGEVNAAVNFNGDDAVVLYKISAAAPVDIFGRIGEDPGTAWTTNSFSTLDKTLVRKSSVSCGVATNPASKFPTLATEWEQYSINTVSNLGGHVFDGSESSPSPPAINPIGAQCAMPGKTLNLTVTATPTDGDPILFFACASAVNPARWSFQTNSGLFSFAPTSNEVGSAQFSFSATDKDGTCAPTAMNVTVKPPPPVASIGSPTNGATSLGVAETLTNLTYALQYTTNLLAAPTVWIEADSIVGTGSNIVLRDEAAAGILRFYRIVLP